MFSVSSPGASGVRAFLSVQTSVVEAILIVLKCKRHMVSENPAPLILFFPATLTSNMAYKLEISKELKLFPTFKN